MQFKNKIYYKYDYIDGIYEGRLESGLPNGIGMFYGNGKWVKAEWVNGEYDGKIQK